MVMRHPFFGFLVAGGGKMATPWRTGPNQWHNGAFALVPLVLCLGATIAINCGENAARLSRCVCPILPFFVTPYPRARPVLCFCAVPLSATKDQLNPAYEGPEDLSNGLQVCACACAVLPPLSLPALSSFALIYACFA
jgi:hypothetical protein